jgi:hypothetical protein
VFGAQRIDGLHAEFGSANCLGYGLTCFGHLSLSQDYFETEKTTTGLLMI